MADAMGRESAGLSAKGEDALPGIAVKHPRAWLNAVHRRLSGNLR